MTFITKTIRSNYLHEDFEVSCWEMNQKNGRTLTIVEHAAFEDIIFNKLHVEGFSYDLIPVAGVADHPVVKCVMRDGNNREIIAIGEAHPRSLINDISRQNPVIMAGNRAFDRAAIRYLNLEGKVYSSEEIQENAEDDGSATESYQNEASDDNENALFSETEPVDSTPSTSKSEIAATPARTADSNPGDTVINFGKYRGKNMTVAEICKNDESWVNYTINMNTDSCGETTKKQIAALKAYKSA